MGEFVVIGELAGLENVSGGIGARGRRGVNEDGIVVVGAGVGLCWRNILDVLG